MLGTAEHPLTIILWGIIAIFILRMLFKFAITVYETIEDHKAEKQKKEIDDLIRGIRK